MSSHSNLPVRIFTSYVGYVQSAVLLLLRLAWGWEAAQSGWRHLHHVARTADFFRELHIPLPVLNVYISGGTELIGGSLLIAGLATRLVAIPVAFNFLVAIIAANGQEIVHEFHAGFLDGWTKIVDDTAFPFLMLALIMLAFGPGKIAADHFVYRLFFRSPDTRPGGFPVGKSG